MITASVVTRSVRLTAWPGRVVAAIILVAAAVIAALAERAAVGSLSYSNFDLQVYWYTSKAVTSGHSIYAVQLPTGLPPSMCKTLGCPVTEGFVYPPFSALLMSPISLLSLPVLKLLWFTGIFGCLEVVLWISLGWAGVRNPWIRLAVVLAALAVLPFFDPIGEEFQAGQVNVFLMTLVLADMRRRDGSVGKGAGVGLAAGLKLTPLLFIVYLAVTRRFKEAWTAVAVFVATVLIGFAVKPTDAWHFWTSYIWQPDRIYPQAGNIYNQSLRAILARLVHSNSPTAAWLPAAVVVLAAGLAVAIMLHRRGLELEAVIAIAFTAELISPVSWVYHWVWFVPLVVCVGVRAALSPTTRGKLGWGVVTLAVAAVPAFHPYTYPSWMLPPTSTTGQLEADSLALAGLLLLALGALLPRSAKSGEASVRSDHEGLPAPQGG